MVAALLALSLVLLVATRPATVVTEPDEGDRPHVLRDLRDGFAFVVRTAWLKWTLLFASFFVLIVLGPIEILLPFIAQDQIVEYVRRNVAVWSEVVIVRVDRGDA